MFLYNQLQKLYYSPERLRRRAKATAVRPFVSRKYNGINFVTEDWDNLIILDACRYDIFETHNIYDQSPTLVHSNATHTREFLHNNFSDNNYDTVYVSATPQITRVSDNFHTVYHLWETDWNDEYKTVLPQIVSKKGLEISRHHPDKRLVIHYIQPHYPFIGEKSKLIGDYGSVSGPAKMRKEPSVWELLSAGKVDAQLVWDAYVENLTITLPYVKSLTDSLEGKTVITSDHGNLFGKRVSFLPISIEGHPAQLPDPELTGVPWLELPFSKRRKIVADDPISREEYDTEKVKKSLEDLGYLT